MIDAIQFLLALIVAVCGVIAGYIAGVNTHQTTLSTACLTTGEITLNKVNFTCEVKK